MPMFPTIADHSLDDVPEDSQVRKFYPRDFYPNPQTVRLPLGKTTYWLLGPEDGPKVALIHGLSTPSIIWKHLAPFLADHGCRVLIYDLYGRGYSEAPDVAYDTNLYITQLALLLQRVQWLNANIVGVSMGGGIAAAFSATFPNLVTEKVVLIASAGLMEDAIASSKPPAVDLGGDQAFSMLDLQKEALPGYSRSLRSSIQFGPVRDMENAFKFMANTSRIKTLIIHGTADDIVPFKYGEKIKELLPAAKFVPIQGADHNSIVAEDYYEEIRHVVLEFLK